MRWVFALLCIAPLLALAPAAARAQSSDAPPAEAAAEQVTVVREEGAESCPDAEALSAHVARLRGHQATGASSAYRVTFSRRAAVFRATIRLSAGGGARELRDRGATCASLEQATALTLALLLDSDLREPASEAEEPKPIELTPEREPSPPPAEQNPPDPDRQRSRASLTLSLGGAGLMGVVQPVVPVALAELGIGAKRFRTSLGVLWMPAQTFEHGPGNLKERLLSGVARTCLAALRGDQAHFDVCTGVYAGLLHVEASGYTRNDSADKAWLAVPLELTVSTTSTPVSVEVGAAALLPLRRNDFAIDNLGVAYESWPVGLMLSMRAVGALLL
ncbi:MAG TPA: hypothetical protein VHB79_30170 [Polyangiaceae bacterium]|nr:hypothetical protein [Polyangiaceae bacterium]